MISLLSISTFLSWRLFPLLEEIPEVAVWHTHPGSERHHYGDALSEQYKGVQVQEFVLEGLGD